MIRRRFMQAVAGFVAGCLFEFTLPDVLIDTRPGFDPDGRSHWYNWTAVFRSTNSFQWERIISKHMAEVDRISRAYSLKNAVIVDMRL